LSDLSISACSLEGSSGGSSGGDSFTATLPPTEFNIFDVPTEYATYTYSLTSNSGFWTLKKGDTILAESRTSANYPWQAEWDTSKVVVTKVEGSKITLTTVFQQD
jgi:hypothetical protein